MNAVTAPLVMIVDDEPLILTMLTEVLRMAEFESQSFSDAEAAHAAFLADPGKYSVVITDLKMPGLKGDQFASLVKKLNPQCLVIVSTGFHPELIYHKPDDYVLLQKPYKIEALLKIIRAQLALANT